jgi:hypothetical protein
LREGVLNAPAWSVMVETVGRVRPAQAHVSRADILVVRQRGDGGQHRRSKHGAADCVHHSSLSKGGRPLRYAAMTA